MKSRMKALLAALVIGTCAAWGQETVSIPEPVKLSEPAWNGDVKAGVGAKTVLLKCIGQKYAEPTIYIENWYKAKGLTKNYNFQNVAHAGLPDAYDGLELTKQFTAGNNPIFMYGDRYDVDRSVMVITDRDCSKVLHSIDLSAWVYAPKKPEGIDFARQQVGYAMVENGILYLSHYHNTYADSSGGQNGYLSAIDLKTMKRLWTTVPLTCNSTFDIVGNSIVCGYGFTSEPDYIYVVDKTTGKRRQTIKVLNGPDEVVIKGNRVYVRTYSYDYLFTFK